MAPFYLLSDQMLICFSVGKWCVWKAYIYPWSSDNIAIVDTWVYTFHKQIYRKPDQHSARKIIRKLLFFNGLFKQMDVSEICL